MTPDVAGRPMAGYIAWFRVAPIFDERSPAVLAMVGSVIEGAARAAGRKIGICGQAPSDYPEFTRFLVERGITSISLNPDALLRGIQAIAEAERVATPAARAAETVVRPPRAPITRRET